MTHFKCRYTPSQRRLTDAVDLLPNDPYHQDSSMLGHDAVYQCIGEADVYVFKEDNWGKCLHEETKNKYNFRNACCHWVQNVLSSLLLSTCKKIKMCRIIIFLLLYMGVKLGLSHWMKNRLAVLKNRVLRRIFGSKRSEVTGKWRRLHKKELYSLYTSPNQKQHALWRGEMLWWENLKEGDHLEYGSIDKGRKVKFTSKEAMKAQRESKDTLLLFL